MPELIQCSWPEVEHYLRSSSAIVIPIGSTEQHGVNGIIGTDALCAEAVAKTAARQAGFMVAPVLAYAPAEFNMAFPGTISIRAATAMSIIEDVVTSLVRSGFDKIYFLNGHGANIAPVRAAFHDLHASHAPRSITLRLKSWWELGSTNTLRTTWYGNAEGLHVTPSEVAITQALIQDWRHPRALLPHRPLSPQAIADRGGDNHEGAIAHRQHFPDGRVGSDPDLATPDAGAVLLNAAAQGLISDFREWDEAHG